MFAKLRGNSRFLKVDCVVGGKVEKRYFSAHLQIGNLIPHKRELYLDSVGLPLKRPQIGATANSILASSDTDLPQQIGEHWIQRFLKHHPEYHERRKRAIDIERLQAVDKTVVERWFEDYRHQVALHGICPEDIYNFDETGFQIGVGKDQWILTREPRKKIFNGATTNREPVTVVECVSTDG